MNKKLITLSLVTILVVISLFTACNTTSTTSSTKTTQAVSTTKITAASTPAQANWWDKLGQPKYGGELVLQTAMFPNSFDPYSFFGLCNYTYEQLITQDWTLDRSVFPFTAAWAPMKYWKGFLARSWDWPDPQTMVIHLQEGVRWHDKSPTNGREFTSEDVIFHYDRLLGTGHGYTYPSPTFSGYAHTFDRATAIDKYTVQIKFAKPSPINNTWTMIEVIMQNMEAPEWVALGGPPPATAPAGGPPGPPGAAPAAEPANANPMTDWHNATGTSVWILTDFVAGSSLTMSKNPNYWGVDERYPQNKLPTTLRSGYF